jgi:hypothetical protein
MGKDEIITRVFTVLNPEIVGNKYLVIGTLDRADWKRIDQKQLPIHDSIEALHDFQRRGHVQANGRMEKIEQRSL